MAKKKATRKRTKAATPVQAVARKDDVTDAAMAEVRAAVSKEVGSEPLVGSQAEREYIGLPLPSLCLRFLMGSTNFPLSRIVQITGEEGSAKSAFLFEIFRWFAYFGGGAVLAENEAKDSPELRHAILQHNEQHINRIEVRPTESMEGWQKVITSTTNALREVMTAKGGPGRSWPMCIGVDSITGTESQETIDKIMDVGHAARGYAIQVLLISQFMKVVPKMLKDIPVTIVGTNHLKPLKEIGSFSTKDNIPGGKSVKFMETYEIKMSRIGDIDLSDHGGLRLKLRATKSSGSPSRRWIDADFLWRFEEDPTTGDMVQHCWWDWYKADIEMLLSFKSARKGKASFHTELQHICDINKVPHDSKCWSKTLGIPQSAPIPFAEAGAALAGRPEVLKALHTKLGVWDRYPFQPGVDYIAQLHDAKEYAEAQRDPDKGKVEEELPVDETTDDTDGPS